MTRMRADDFDAIEEFRIIPEPEPGEGRKALREWRGSAKFACESETAAVETADAITQYIGNSARWTGLDIAVQDNVVLIADVTYTARGANAADLERVIFFANMDGQIVSPVAIRTVSSTKLGPGR